MSTPITKVCNDVLLPNSADNHIKSFLNRNSLLLSLDSLGTVFSVQHVKTFSSNLFYKTESRVLQKVVRTKPDDNLVPMLCIEDYRIPIPVIVGP